MVVDFIVAIESDLLRISSPSMGFSLTEPALIALTRPARQIAAVGKAAAEFERADAAGRPITPEGFTYLRPFNVKEFDPSFAQLTLSYYAQRVYSQARAHWLGRLFLPFGIDRFSCQLHWPEYESLPAEQRALFLRQLFTEGLFRQGLELWVNGNPVSAP